MITVIDSIMGSGKTSWAIQYMIENPNINFLYVTPYLDEIQRVMKETSIDGFKRFYEPTNKNKKGTKLEGLKLLLNKQRCIATTHELFSTLDNECKELIDTNNYMLIMDEVFNVIEKEQISRRDIDILIQQKVIDINKDGMVVWQDPYYIGKFTELMMKCLNNSVYLHSETFSVFYWVFPASIFSLFKDIVIMTYLFDYQVQAFYYNLFNFKYTKCQVVKENNRYELIEWNSDLYHKEKENIKTLINLYDDEKLNTNYYHDKDNQYTILSSSWLKTHKLDQLKKNLINYFKNIINTKASDALWTIKKEYMNSIKSPDSRTSKNNFIPMNCRATNQYGDRHNLAYLYNKFFNPVDRRFFENRNIHITREDEENFALSELLQWIYRSAIRNNEQINIYVPAKRMRDLLFKYLNN